MSNLNWDHLCADEWSGRQWSCATFIHWRLAASSLVIDHWRSHVGRWPGQSSRSTAEQWTTTTTRPHWHKLSSQAVGANTIMLQRTHSTTLHYTPHVITFFIISVQPRPNVISVFSLHWVIVSQHCSLLLSLNCSLLAAYCQSLVCETMRASHM